MAPELAALLVGLSTPAALRAPARRGTHPRLIIAAQLAGLVLVWTGIVGVLVAAFSPASGFFELCRAIVTSPAAAFGPLPASALALLTVALPGRALVHAIQTITAGRALHKGVMVTLHGTVVAGASMDTIACTVGVLRPRVVVDLDQLARLTAEQQRAVLAHEDGHAHGLHGLIVLVSRALAAGLAPWPGARQAATEIRRQLEAAADDRAAHRTGRRTVAGAIVAAACGPPPAGALGAAGWALWRVDRLLRRSAPDRRATLVASGVLILLGLVAGHWALHSAHLLSGWKLAFLAEVCCTV